MTEYKREPAVVDGVLKYTSISAVNRFLNCERSWWFRYVQRLPDEAGRAAEYGTQGHARLTRRVNYNIPLDVYLPVDSSKHFTFTDKENAKLVALCEEALPYIRVYDRADVSVEGHLYAAGVPFKGALDLISNDPRLPLVTDFKFKGKIGIDPLDLANVETEAGRQMLAYARAVTQMLPNAEYVALRHLHLQTKGRAKVEEFVYGPVSLARVNEAWEIIGTHVERIKNVAKATKPEDVEPNRGFCWAYHKACPFMQQCPVGSNSFADMFLGGSQVGILDQLKKLSSEPVEQIGAQPEAPTAIPERILSFGATYTLADGTAGELQSINGGIGRFIIGKGTSSAAFRDVALSTVGDVVMATLGNVATQAAEQEDAKATAPPAEAPKKRGRPKKEPIEAPLLTSSEYLAIKETGDIKNAAAFDGHARLVLPVEDKGIYLYIGCAPLGVKTQTLHAYTDELEAGILRTMGETMPDVRLSTSDMLSFGKWKAVFAKVVKDHPPPPGDYVADTVSGEKVGVVVDTLIGMLSTTPRAVVR